jgi:DNA-binding NarL/FixJ family response regulator
MKKKYRVVIVDDHEMFRAGVKVLLRKSENIEFVGEAANGADFLELMENIKPDVVLMDISMPVMDGIETTKQAIKQNPDIKILALSMFGEEEYYYKMVQAGVCGFVLKSSGFNELENAIIKVANGSSFFSEELLRYVLNNINSNGNADKVPVFKEEEIKILQLLSQNQSDEDIAKTLTLEVVSIQDLRKSLMSKTGTNNTTALILYALSNKIVSL